MPNQIIKFCALFLVFLALISCGADDNLRARKIVSTPIVIKSSKKSFDPNLYGFPCDSLRFIPISVGNYIQKIVINNGFSPLDTIETGSKKLVKGLENEIIKADLNFDGFCEFVIPDKNSTKLGGIKHYYFIFDNAKRQFIENKSLPPYISNFKMDIKNQRVKLYCPNTDCFAYYKYSILNKFELVQGEFKD